MVHIKWPSGSSSRIATKTLIVQAKISQSTFFLHGGGEVGCPSNGGIYNNERPIWLGGQLFMNMVDNNKFDGFLVYPQFVVSSGCFSGWLNTPTGNLLNIFAMLDSMAKYVRADIDRVLITGLSGGAYGAWKLAQNYPSRAAKIMPSAGIGNASSALFIFLSGSLQVKKT